MMELTRAIEILDPEHREQYKSLEEVEDACRMGMEALKAQLAAAQPGSVMCLVNRMRYGGTHADDAPPRQAGNFCQFCGQPLRVIGTERFCNNVNCQNRYINV